MPPKLYFKNLDGLRFIAAFFVILHHTDEGLNTTGHGGRFHFPLVFGPLAVRFFFVLSGFLITYLLFEEKQQTGSINIKGFYVRRILRIWPLYYLVVGLALFVLPHIAFFNIPPYFETLRHHYLFKILLLMLFVPNILYAVNQDYVLPYGDQLWSIGVEEQFYLLWPWLVKRVKNYPKALISIIIIFVFLTNNFIAGFAGGLRDTSIIDAGSAICRVLGIINNFFSGWANFQIDSMAVGALGAYIIFYNKEVFIKLLFNKTLTRLLLAVFLFCVAFLHHYHIYLVFSIIFLVFILNMAFNPANKFNLEYAWLRYLGRISYGIYMLHPIAIIIAVKLIYPLPGPILLLQMLTYLVAILLSIGLAALSYHLFEINFLKLKRRFSPLPGKTHL